MEGGQERDGERTKGGEGEGEKRRGEGEKEERLRDCEFD